MLTKSKLKRNSDGSSFVISLVLNLLWNYEFLIVAIVVLVLHFTINAPMWLFWLSLLIWVLPALLMTLFLFFLSGLDSGKVDVKENKNPYSVGQNKPKISENKNPYSNKK